MLFSYGDRMIKQAMMAAVAALVLAGCQTKTVEEMNYTELKALADVIAKRCLVQGVKPGTPEMKMCTQVEAGRESAVRRRRAAVEDAAAARPRGPTMCQNFGGNIVCF